MIGTRQKIWPVCFIAWSTIGRIVDARYGLDYDGEAVPFEYTCAYLIGLTVARSQDEQRLREPAEVVLDRFNIPMLTL